ncbi:hypothetical protein KEF85_08260 [Methylomonas paludis]|uniref:Uncharacterized protein n=1 Tax=Methylomonas paludis TaxID=1173101 RepID=A0A975RBH6_9GAMM|nr:hypothetical protein [Methylomonas paludis]QWF72423.1 hypothetical protein KEF85_08260 [Methylomonas paludis]
MNTQNTQSLTTNPNNSVCRHPTLITEYAYGGPTGNFICLQCKCLVPANQHRAQPQSSYWQNSKDALVV